MKHICPFEGHHLIAVLSIAGNLQHKDKLNHSVLFFLHCGGGGCHTQYRNLDVDQFKNAKLKKWQNVNLATNPKVVKQNIYLVWYHLAKSKFICPYGFCFFCSW